MYPTHKECLNFRDGFCALFRVRVNSNGRACPNFVPKNFSTHMLHSPSSKEIPSIEELMRRLDEAEKRLKEIMEMIKRL